MAFAKKIDHEYRGQASIWDKQDRETKILKKKYTAEDYYATPEHVHVELIDGVFYNMAPPNRRHQRIAGILYARIFNYIESRHGSCEVYPAPFGVELFSENDPTIVEPDISVICDKDKLTDRGCTGAPDWIIEIVSPSNEKHDYLRKLNLYLKSGVREYWIVNPMSENVIVYQMSDEDAKGVGTQIGGEVVNDGEEGMARNLTVSSYSFRDRIKAGIYEDLWIDMGEMEVS